MTTAGQMQRMVAELDASAERRMTAERARREAAAEEARRRHADAFERAERMRRAMAEVEAQHSERARHVFDLLEHEREDRLAAAAEDARFRMELTGARRMATGEFVHHLAEEAEARHQAMEEMVDRMAEERMARHADVLEASQEWFSHRQQMAMRESGGPIFRRPPAMPTRRRRPASRAAGT